MRYLLVTLCLAMHLDASTQSFPFIGPRANGLGYASVCLSDEWAAYNNPAGIAVQDQYVSSICHDVFPAVDALSRSSLSVALPFLKGGFGFGAFRCGNSAYNEQALSAAYGNTFGITSLGVGLQYIQYNAEGFGRKGVITISLGGITDLTSWLKVGACIINVNQPRLDDQEKMPTILVVGVALKVSANVNAFLEAEKNISNDPILKAAVEYTFNKKFVIRTGVHPSPAAGFFGFGFKMKKLNADYALSVASGIGNRHQFGIAYKFPRRK